jgi:hypothetical protein
LNWTNGFGSKLPNGLNVQGREIIDLNQLHVLTMEMTDAVL